MMPTQITHEKAIITEGKDDMHFVIHYCKHLNFNPTEIDFGSVDGKDKFEDELSTYVKNPGFSNLKKIAVIRDAEQNYKNTFKSMCTILKKLNLPCPDKTESFTSGTPSTGIFIFPSKNRAGMLEDLLIDTVRDSPIIKRGCVDSFIKCVKTSAGYSPQTISKAKLMAFLAVQKEAVNLYSSMIEKKYLNSDSPALEPLRDFLQELYEKP